MHKHCAPPSRRQVSGGFTLIEVIAVLVLLGILGVAAITSYSSLQNESRRRGAQNLVAAAQSQLTLDFSSRSVAGLPLDTPSQTSCNLAIATASDVNATLTCSGSLNDTVTIDAAIDGVPVSANWSSPLTSGS